MDNPITKDQKEKRISVRYTGKAWRYIQDVTGTDAGNLDRKALEDGSRQYTYRLMFHEWERYASVFSALGITGEKHSRVGLLGSTSAETIFTIYGLNMTGAEVSLVPAYSALFTKKIMETIRSENLTDFIVTDDFAQGGLVHDLLAQKKALGLNHVIILHIPVTGVTVNPMLTAVQEAKHEYLKGLYGHRQICMDELLEEYDRYPISYAPEESSDTAFILHTSGTTSGAGKPVVLSDKAFNAAASGFFEIDGLDLPYDDLETAVIVDLSNAYSIIDQVHVPFAIGAAVAVAPGGVLNPWFYKAIPHYRITFLFTISAMFERWMKLPESVCPDFSGLRFVVLGGTSVSAADKRRYYEFMRRHGAGDVILLNGYGISEMGGACFLSSPDIDDESIGKPLHGINVRLFDEDSGEYLAPGNAPCEGVLYLNAPSLATRELDGRIITDYEYIDGRPYICTNDYARMEKDGRLIFLGRANRYFINEEGRKYESGRVETEISRQAGIESCCVVPVYIKTTHDNIPMLCVKTLESGNESKAVICKALRQVFISEKTLEPDSIPYRVMIADELPRNANGKIDLYRISRGEVEGETFAVKTVRILDRITDFKLLPYEEGPADMIKEVFDGISAELKSNMPHFNNNSDSDAEGEKMEMDKVKKAVESIYGMHRMGLQMTKNMMGRMQQMNSAGGSDHMPFGSMDDLQKMAARMSSVNQKAKNMFPEMDKIAKAHGAVKAHDMAQELTNSMLPAMKAQMEQMMQGMAQMNLIALGTMQNVFDQNYKMMQQVFDTVQKMSDVPAKDGDTAAPVKEEETAAATNGEGTTVPGEGEETANV